MAGEGKNRTKMQANRPCAKGSCIPALFYFRARTFLDLYIYFMYMSALSACRCTCQKRASNHTIDGYEPPCGSWGLNGSALNH